MAEIMGIQMPSSHAHSSVSSFAYGPTQISRDLKLSQKALPTVAHSALRPASPFKFTFRGQRQRMTKGQTVSCAFVEMSHSHVMGPLTDAANPSLREPVMVQGRLPDLQDKSKTERGSLKSGSGFESCLILISPVV